MTSSDENSAANRFRTTHWSVIAAARDGAAPQAQAALASLCEAYWYPLYAFIRRQGHAVEDARDLTQEFFARLLEKDYLGAVDPEKGKFRSFLLACCKHFLANECDKARARKRGGGRRLFSFDADMAESRYAAEPCHNLTAEKLFERRWALVLLQNVLGQLRAEQEKAGKGSQFDRLKIFLAGERAAQRYAEVAQTLETTVGALKVAVHRLRGRFRELLRAEIARTVQEPADMETEIHNLFAALSS